MGGCRKKACSNKCSCREKRIGCYRGPEIPCLNVEEGDIYDDIIGKIGEVICEGGFEEGGRKYTFENNEECETGGIVVKDSSGEIVFSQCYDSCCPDIEIQHSEILQLKDQKTLKPGRTYHITDRDIWVRAVDVDQVSSEATRRFSIVKDEHYTPNGNFLGIYGQTIAKEAVPVSSGTTVYRVIWGGRVWQRDTTGADVAGSSDEVIQGGWTMIPTTNTTYYEPKMFSVDYDLDQDIVWVQRDDRGNIIKRPTSSTSFIDITDWGNSDIDNNVCAGIFNNHMNTFGKAIIRQNRVLVYIANTTSVSGINNNTCEVIYNNTITSNLVNNHISGAITNNQGCLIRDNRNNGHIQNNTSVEIFGNQCNGPIEGNITAMGTGRIERNDNNGGIFNNVLDGVGVDILNNTNNGDIGTTTPTTRVVTVTDSTVNK